MKVLLTGGTGLIGKEIGKELVRRGHEVVVISRNAAKAQSELPYPAVVVEGDLVNSAVDSPFIKECSAVIHLLGENVGEGRWTDEKKEAIINSRVNSTKNLWVSLTNGQLKTFISSSATGYYGDRADEELGAGTPAGTGFLAEVCEKWENEVFHGAIRFQNARKDSDLAAPLRSVSLRTGMVLSPSGGALKKLIPLFQFGLGGVLGDGQQWQPWIHIDDITKMYLWALDNPDAKGAYNAVAPTAVRNKEFTKVLAKSLGVRQGPPAPRFALKAALGEMSSIVLDSQNARPQRVLSQGFEFRYPDLESAIADAVKYNQDREQVLISEQYLPLKKETIFPFFSDPQNLESLTPQTLNFKIQKTSTLEVEEGTLIDYKLKIRGVPVGWKTQIKNWNPPHQFVDDQLKGPYSKWNHTHRFEDLGPGTLMTDIVRYKLPWGRLGRGVAGSLVDNDVQGIFTYRRKVLQDMQNQGFASFTDK